MSELITRLKEVRERMGLTQTAFGTLGGVSKGSQIAYERGRAQPAVTYLERLAESGVNRSWTYEALMGRRNGLQAQAQALRHRLMDAAGL